MKKVIGVAVFAGLALGAFWAIKKWRATSSAAPDPLKNSPYPIAPNLNPIPDINK